MNADIEKTLKELGPEYESVYTRLVSARELETSCCSVVRIPARRRVHPWVALPIAASVLFAAAMSFWFLPDASAVRKTRRTPVISAGPYSLAFSVSDENALDEIIRTQNADGSWSNDLLTRQNAAALGLVDATSIAYRKALRYLRSRGLAPLSLAEYSAKARICNSFVRCD